MPLNCTLKMVKMINFMLYIVYYNFFFINFIYLFLAALGPCCCAQAFSSCTSGGPLFRCGARASHCGGPSPCGARAPSTRASAVVARGLGSCSARAQLLRGMWDPPRPGLEPVSPALAGGFLTTAPLEKPLVYNFKKQIK